MQRLKDVARSNNVLKKETCSNGNSILLDFILVPCDGVTISQAFSTMVGLICLYLQQQWTIFQDPSND